MAWSYLTTDFVTGRILTQNLPLVGVTYTEVLNGSGDMSGEVPLADPTIDSLAALNACIEGRTAIYVLSDGVIQWGGQVIASDYSSSDRKLKLKVRGMFGYFSSLVVNPYLATAYGPVIYSYAVDMQVNVAMGLSPYWLGDPGGIPNPPFWYFYAAFNAGNAIRQPGAVVPTLNVDLSAWTSKDLASVIADLSASGDGFGFDFGFTFSIYDWFGDGTQIPVPTLNTYYPHRGTTDPDIVFTFAALTGSGNISSYTWPVDASGQSVRTGAIGAGSATSQQIVFADDPTLSVDGYPMSATITQHSNLTQTSTLTAAMHGEQAATSKPAKLPTITVRLDEHPTIGTYQVGDTCRVRICDPARFPTPGQADGTFGHDSTWRIQQIATTPIGQSDASAVLTLMAP